jgi:hypothetical protein
VHQGRKSGAAALRPPVSGIHTQRHASYPTSQPPRCHLLDKMKPLSGVRHPLSQTLAAKCGNADVVHARKEVP